MANVTGDTTNRSVQTRATFSPTSREIIDKPLSEETIPIHRLTINAHYQRPWTASRSEKMAAEWDWHLYRNLEIAPTEPNIKPHERDSYGGTFDVLDGQHEFRAMEIKTFPEARCKVHWNLTEPEKAFLFHDLNTNRVGLKALHEFNSLLYGGEASAVAIDAALQRYNLKLESGKPGDKSKNTITAVKALKQAYDWGVLDQTIDIVMNAWPEDMVSRRQTVLLGMAAFLTQYRKDISLALLVDKLRKVSVAKMLRDAEEKKSLDGGTAWGHLMYIVVREYNKGRAQQNRLELRRQPVTNARPFPYKKGQKVAFEGGADKARRSKVTV